MRALGLIVLATAACAAAFADAASAAGVTITVSLNPSTLAANGHDTATVTATVTDSTNAPLAGDAVTFTSSDSGQMISPATAVTNANGIATATLSSSTAPGEATITAADGTGSAGQATLRQVPVPTTVSLLASQSTVATNEAFALWAAVTAPSGQPAGTVTFSTGGSAIPGCGRLSITAAHPVAGCRAALAASASPATISAVFTPGTGSSFAGASASTVITVNKATTSVALSAPTGTHVGEHARYVVGISPQPGGGSILPSGAVTFSDNGRQIRSCRAVPVRSGGTTCTVAYASTGSHVIRAEYSGDANFTGSTSHSQVMRVTSPPARGTLNATMQWTFRYTSTYTSILQFGISGATNTTVTVSCRGRGCPFVARTIRVAKTQRCGRGRRRICPTRGKVDLLPSFQGRRLRAGTTITVLISRPSWVGKHYTFTVRARRGPAIAISCMAPGGTRPGSGCGS